MNKLGELVIFYQKKGRRETLARIRARYFSILTFVHYQRDLWVSFQGLMPDGDIKIVVDDFDLLERERKLRDDLPREFYVDQTHQCRHVYLLFVADELAGVCWIFKQGDYSRFFRITSEDCCELNYITTLPNFRGGKLSTKFTNYICADLLRKNIKRVVLSISSGNSNCLKTMQDANFYEFKKVKSICSILKRMKI